MAIDYESLGKRIANARKQTGITQEALGEQLENTSVLSKPPLTVPVLIHWLILPTH